MDRNKKEQIIEKNITDIHVGEVFKSEKSLIKILLELKQISGGRNRSIMFQTVKDRKRNPMLIMQGIPVFTGFLAFF